ncbi:MAG TPA: hypothetical protein VN258_06520 [Mobilitalea sp.]|nr:hypothetical protein [Mobilitalea sp.]
MDNHEVTLKCYPVCDCGQVIKNLLGSYDNGMEIGCTGMKFIPRYNFDPSVCPKCGRKIIRLSMQTVGENGNLDFRQLER